MFNDILPMADVPENAKVQIVSFSGGYNFVRRLQEMGLVPGQIAKLIRNSKIGPVEVSVMGSNLAIGRGIASKILVRIMYEQG